MEVVLVASIIVGEPHRSINPMKVDDLAISMKQIGLQYPISIFRDEKGMHLITGFHRLKAAKKLGWDKIACNLIHLSELERELWEIDENLARAELTTEEEGEHLLRRKELWEKQQAEAKSSGASCAGTDDALASARLICDFDLPIFLAVSAAKASGWPSPLRPRLDTRRIEHVCFVPLADARTQRQTSSPVRPNRTVGSITPRATKEQSLVLMSVCRCCRRSECASYPQQVSSTAPTRAMAAQSDKADVSALMGLYAEKPVAGIRHRRLAKASRKERHRSHSG